VSFSAFFSLYPFTTVPTPNPSHSRVGSGGGGGGGELLRRVVDAVRGGRGASYRTLEDVGEGDVSGEWADQCRLLLELIFLWIFPANVRAVNSLCR